MEFTIILAYAFGLGILLILGYLLIIPLKYLGKLILNGIIGGILLLILNFFGKFIGVTIGINPITALIVGFLGIPGILMLLILQYIL